MDQPPGDPLLYFLAIAVLLVGVATWFVLVVRWHGGQPPLRYEPRSPVPWGAPIAMFAVVFVVIAISAALSVDPTAEPDEPNPLEVAQQLVGFIVFQCAVVGGVLILVAAIYRPTLRDFGLPEYAEELVRDVGIGIVACLAAIVPVYAVQLLMLVVFGPSEHPLVTMVTGGEPNVGLLILATITAVLVAPLSEEIFFRLLLQGWLEKWEDRRTAERDATISEPAPVESAPELIAELENDEARMTNDELEATGHSSFVIRHSSFPLPHGSVPILISSLLFALAHFGYGPDPIALFLLALVLGYVYQRTHRIVPCIVAHALFNLLAMLILWRAVFLSAE